MRKINFLEFPPYIRIRFKDDANFIYWTIVEEEAGSILEATRKLGLKKDVLYDAKNRGVGLPLAHFIELEKEYGINLNEWQGEIDYYTVGSRNDSKIIPEIDSERKLPLEFDEEMIVALSAIMWSEDKRSRRFFFYGPKEQRSWLYRTFKDHFGQIVECKKTCANGWYPAQKVITDIGLYYIDKNILDFTHDESLAVFLGSYAAHGLFSGPIAIYARKQEPRERVVAALNRLGMEFTDRGEENERRLSIRKTKGRAERIYSDTKEFYEKYDVKPFLEPVLEYFKLCAGK